MSREQFSEWMQDAIVVLPQSVKAMLRIVDDPDLPDEGRASAAGALLHWLSASNTIPGVRGGALALVDDVLVMRLVCERLCEQAPEAMTRHLADSPELLGNLAEDLKSARGYLLGVIGLLDKVIAQVSRFKHKGHTAEQCVRDEDASNWLYDEVQAALVDVDMEPEAVARELKRMDSVIAPLRQRLPG